MIEAREKLPWRLLFLFICLLAASDLILFAAFMNSGKNYAGLEASFHKSTSYINEKLGAGLHTISSVPGHVSKLAVDVVDVKSFIRPADNDRLPAITPAAALAGVTQTPSGATTDSPTVAAPASNVSTITAAPPAQLTSANLYAWGNCTWWVSARRTQTGHPIPNTWGNATAWAQRAVQDGYLVDHMPSPRAIMQLSGGLGHVAFIESVDPDGTWHISEMNVIGLNLVDHQARPPGAAANYNFIH